MFTTTRITQPTWCTLTLRSADTSQHADVFVASQHEANAVVLTYEVDGWDVTLTPFCSR